MNGECEMTEEKSLLVYVLSDSVGGTAGSIFNAARAQFPGMDFKLKNFPFVRDIEQLETILERAVKNNAIVLHTFVNPTIVEKIESYCVEYNLTHFDVVNPLINEIVRRTDIEPTHKPGAKHRLDDKYFNRISALEFAIQYDDGQDPKGFLEADIVILGISRTSKTPLSIYLANQNYKVANLPLIPEARIPDEIWQVASNKIIGLTNDEEMLSNIRKERMISYGMEADTTYSNMERIKKEIRYADELYEKLGCQVINVVNKSIEETAAIIIESLER